MAILLSDVRWTLRLIRHRPAFAVTIVGTLTVAIAAVATAFGVATTVLWRPLPFGDPDRLVFAWESSSQEDPGAASRVTGSRFDDWQRGAASLEALALFGSTGFLVDRAEGASIVNGVRVSTNYFDTLRIAPLLGRGFTASDGEPGRERVVILSHGLWQQWFGGVRDVVGQELRLARRPYTIIGVMPPVVFPAWPVNPASVTLDPDSRQLWVPIARTPALAANARAHVYGVVGRLAAGRSLVDAGRELSGMADGADPDRHGAIVRPFRDQFVRDARGPLLALLGAALAVLLMACTNLAALQGAAIESRRTELGVRVALGAGRRQLARQLATEAAVLATAGGVAGLALSRAALAWIPGLLPASVPLLTPPSLGLTGTLVGAGATTCAAIALAAWPFARATASSAPAPRGNPSIARSGAFRALVVAQVALAIGLVASAALLQQSLDTVRGQDAGFVIDRVLVGGVTLAGPAYDDPARTVAGERRLSETLSRIPGVRGVAFAYDHPLESNWTDAFTISGSGAPADGARDSAELRIVSPSYFEALGVVVIDGRTFTERDDLDAAGAVVVNESFMRRTGGAALDRTIRSATPALNWGGARLPSEFRIVGIVEDERFKGLELPSAPAVYMSTRQFPQGQLTTLLRTDVEPASLAPAVRETIKRFDSQVPVGSFAALSSILADQLVTRRATTHVIDGFAAGALALAGLGLYGLLALLVAAGARETGIRLALGSSPRLEAGRVARACLQSTAAGAACGVGLALIGGRLVQSLLVGVSPRDPVTLAAVCLVMLLVAAAAASLPAWRAARVDPATVLRGGP
jgi:putative ABC transport system permease protein